MIGEKDEKIGGFHQGSKNQKGQNDKVFAHFKKRYIPAEVEDVYTVVFQFRSGILGHLGSNFASPRINWIRVYGTETNLPRITMRSDRPFAEAMKLTSKSDIYTRLELFEKGKDQAVEIPLPQGDPILEEIDEFAHCIQNGARRAVRQVLPPLFVRPTGHGYSIKNKSAAFRNLQIRVLYFLPG